jgi:hypothetical protein
MSTEIGYTAPKALKFEGQPMEKLIIKWREKALWNGKGQRGEKCHRQDSYGEPLNGRGSRIEKRAAQPGNGNSHGDLPFHWF